MFFRNLTLGDTSVIQLLIEYRYKYDDNLFLGGDNGILDVNDNDGVNQEVIATFATLDKLISKCKFNDRQLKMIEMIGEGYTYREIEDEIGIDNQNVNKALKSIFKSILKENLRFWRKSTYINKLGLKTKQCTKCEEFLPATSEFFADKNDSKDLLHPYCRKCKK